MKNFYTARSTSSGACPGRPTAITCVKPNITLGLIKLGRGGGKFLQKMGLDLELCAEVEKQVSSDPETKMVGNVRPTGAEMLALASRSQSA
jgi:hypothetical protein